jgi:hypothetical protein
MKALRNELGAAKGGDVNGITPRIFRPASKKFRDLFFNSWELSGVQQQEISFG